MNTQPDLIRRTLSGASRKPARLPAVRHVYVRDQLDILLEAAGRVIDLEGTHTREALHRIVRDSQRGTRTDWYKVGQDLRTAMEKARKELRAAQ